MDQHEINNLYTDLLLFLTKGIKAGSLEEIAFITGYEDALFGVDLRDSYIRFISERVYCYNIEIHSFMIGYATGQVEFLDKKGGKC